MQAMIRTAPPQAAQVWTSKPLAFQRPPDAQRQGLGQPGKPGTGGRLHPAKAQRAVVTLDMLADSCQPPAV
jgi:hypothetical protein